MANEPITQTIQQLKAAKNVLIIAGNTNNIDTISATLSLREFLSKLEKQVVVVSTLPVPPKLKFLPETSNVKEGDRLSKNLVIDISTLKNEIDELKYQKFEDKLSIFLTAKNGEFESSAVSVRPNAYPFDLVVTIGIANLEDLGNFYTKHTQLFFDLPVINIDFRASNENYATINLVGLTSSSSSEVIFDLLLQFDENFIDERIATMLLTGVISQTNSFQSLKTSPQVFIKASKLVGMGAKQQEIITQLYRSKSLGFLRLWGRVLARVKHESTSGLVYSVANSSDIQKSEANSEDVEEIIFELVQQLSFAKTFGFLAEANNETTVYLSTTLPVSLMKLFASYQPKSINNAIKFTLNKPLTESEPLIISQIQAELAKY